VWLSQAKKTTIKAMNTTAIDKKSTHPPDRASRCVHVNTHQGCREVSPSARKTGRVGMRAGGQKVLDAGAHLDAMDTLNLAQDGGWHLGRLLGYGLFAQDLPSDIGAQVFAANQTVGSLLDLGASFSGDLAQAVSPLADSARRHTDQACDFHLAGGLKVGFEFHGVTLALLSLYRQAMLKHIFVSVAI